MLEHASEPALCVVLSALLRAAVDDLDICTLLGQCLQWGRSTGGQNAPIAVRTYKTFCKVHCFTTYLSMGPRIQLRGP